VTSPHVLVTGGAGFIGSHVVDLLMERPGMRVTVVDKLTYAGSLENLALHDGADRFSFVQADVADADEMRRVVAGVDHVIHAAAESFVDRSIADAGEFVRTNVVGTHTVLEACRRSGIPLLNVSTDEVYGEGSEVPGEGLSEDDPLAPRSPYAASKAAGDLLCRAYHVTHGSAVTVARGTNAYGPRQHPEKGLPTYAIAALQSLPVPVYGDGRHRREWLFATDFARALLAIMDRGEPGGVYNVGGGFEIENRDLAARICRLAGVSESLITSVPDRPGHDRRYGLRWERLAALGWRPEVSFDEGLARTVEWYRERLAAGVSP
jgi:dTDP-glucose 4,6-dehydratase